MRPSPESPSIALGTADGGIAIVRATDGGETARTAPGGGTLADLTFDAWAPSLVAYRESEEGEGGEILRFALDDAASPGEGAKVAWIDGTARLAAIREGLVVFEENVGARWKLFPRAGAPVPSVACPRPSSFVVDEAADHTRIVALALVDEGWRRVSVRATSAGFDACTVSELPGFALASPRIVRLSNGTEVAVGIDQGGLALVPLIPGGASSIILGVQASSVATVSAFVLGGANGIVALTSDPPRVVALRLEVADGTWSVPEVRSLDLSGAIATDDRSISRSLACAPGSREGTSRVLVATGAGLFAADVTIAPSGLDLAIASLGANPGDGRAPLASLE